MIPGEVRIQNRVDRLNGDVRRRAFIALEQAQNRRVFVAGRSDQRKRHVLFQRVRDALRLVGQGVQLVFREIRVRDGFRQRGNEQVHGNGNRHHNRRRDRGITARAHGATAEVLFEKRVHQLTSVFPAFPW